MYNESYEDYIRSILGYSDHNNMFENNYQAMPTNYMNNNQNQELEECYPEIYRMVYPMVTKACSENTKPVNSILIDELTNEIYSAIENDTNINININSNNQVLNVENRNISSNTKKEGINQQNRGEDRQIRNRGLQDLIRILLIRELLGRPGNFPGNRPPIFPPRPPMRPPFPGGPGQGPRPPIMPRDIY